MPTRFAQAIPPKARAVARKSCVLLVLLCVFGTPCLVKAQDAKTILHNMTAAYQGLNSYQGSANVSDRQLLSGGKLLAEGSFTSSIIYQKPNKLRIQFSMPTGGRTVYYDGSTLTLYQSKLENYSSVRVTAADLKQLAPALFKFKVASKLDVLYFLSGNDLPATLTGFERKPDQSRNGKQVYVVTAREPTSNPKFSYNWTWYIDKQSSLLDRIEARLSGIPQRAKVVQGKKVVVKEFLIDRVLVQTIINPQPNSRIDNKVFVFVPPAGSSKVDTPGAQPPVGRGK